MKSAESKLLEAIAFAAKKHTNQRRKNVDASPYINHPIEVAALLADDGGVTDTELLVAAILHDTVEDTKTTFEEIEEQFGAAVRDLVAEVTDDKRLEKHQRKALQIENAPHKSDRAKQLKIADKTCNVRDIDADNPAGWERTRRIAYLKWAQQVVDHCRGVNPKLERRFDEAIATAGAKLGEP